MFLYYSLCKLILCWQIASGHADGSIRLWDCERGTCEATLNGHKSAVTVLRYNPAGSLLASGSKDCDIILWDVIGEAGVFRLRGHRDQVSLSFFCQQMEIRKIENIFCYHSKIKL